MIDSQYFLQNKNIFPENNKINNFLSMLTILKALKSNENDFFTKHSNFLNIFKRLNHHDADVIMSEIEPKTNKINGDDKSSYANNMNILNMIMKENHEISRIQYSALTEGSLINVANPQCNGCGMSLSIIIFENPNAIFCCEECLQVICKYGMVNISDCKDFLLKNKLGCLNCN